MTTFQRINSGSGHSYRLNGVDVPGVTSVIGLLDKPALVNWAAEQSAAHAIEHWSRLSEMTLADRYQEILRARFKTNKTATARGHRLHAMAEAMQKGINLDHVPPEHALDAGAIARLLDAWEVEPVATELPVASTDHLYAGTLDTIIRCPRLGTTLWDFKTGKKVYDETALQLAAYARADVALIPHEVVGPRGGRKTILEQGPLPALDTVDRAYVVHVADGVASLHPIDTDRRTFDVFLALLDVFYDWHRRVGWNYRGTDHYEPTVHEPINPETTVIPTGDQP